MRALVTGAGGFLGRYLCEQLVARGDQVRGFSRAGYPELAALGVEQVRGDVRDEAAVVEACRDVEVVYHTAALAGIGNSYETFFGINTLGTRHVLTGCRKHGVPRLVFTSSPSVVFAAGDQCNVDESVPYPESFLAYYPQTKAIAEQEVLAANGKDGLLTCALRPHLIWGPRDQHLIPRLLARAREGKLRRVGDGKNLVDMIYVENAADAHLAACDRLVPGSPVCGRAYFLSHGEPVNCWDWIDEILALAGLPPVEYEVSYTTAWYTGLVLENVYWLLGWEEEPRMTRFLAAQLATSHYYDITRARTDLGYTPRVSKEEGMRRLGAWLQTQKPSGVPLPKP